ncbi:MsnO8 family LLM class oxidoreductase [Nesterenkonia sp. F]|uniref:MsnO8 family LLM class oxidoreductase n=1 Tax=Nesterenkonia sp. F TaxID=795955 RepID=UPI000255CE72|nr:MsnO8 family LLM class oxidoreductase [Nesterenkonia sp. F]
MRISLLDRARTRAGEPDAAALTGLIDRARRAEALGFQRFWVAEHHGVPGVAGGSPLMLLAALGARTERIRLGTGGVMLPNHRPLIVAEQARLLEALHPGRLDLGLGASLGYTAGVRRALGRSRLDDGEYPALVRELIDHLHDDATITARPQVAEPPPLFQLAMGDGLAVAAELGLPAVVGGGLLRRPDRLEAYRRGFRPTSAEPQPRLILSLDVAVADSTAQARRLLLPEAWALARTREVGEFRPLEPLETVEEQLSAGVSDAVDEAIRRHRDAAVVGTAAEVGEQLTDLLEASGAEEVMAWTSIHDREQLAASDEALASLITG